MDKMTMDKEEEKSTIMVVDDTSANLTLLQEMLEDEGYLQEMLEEGEEKATIMVVDDTSANLTLLQEMLEDEGYRVVAFPRGSMALNAAVKNPPDLILLDIRMPDMDGFEVCRRLKADEVLKEITVLFISALNETTDKISAFAAGGVDYITKPFQFEEVYARVKTHIELSRLRRQLQQAYHKIHELEIGRTTDPDL